ncbi:hypothetical protein TCAL_04581 [Tigriopus californicus]|uniref:Uncharacterized protein n=1 Tax=Tigriopus californicus TaxID=6832 RepID=A0A553PCC8_TIGCA|nr:hypothetical protein TCAL_04581 [Tigriopus californicus]
MEEEEEEDKDSGLRSMSSLCCSTAVPLAFVLFVALAVPDSLGVQGQSSNCPTIPEVSDECLCQESANCPMIPEVCFKSESQNTNCPEIRADCLEEDPRIRVVDQNLHNKTFNANVKTCLLTKKYERLSDICDDLGKAIKVAMPFIINRVSLGDNECILNAGEKVLCLAKIHDKDLYCGLVREFKFR